MRAPLRVASFVSFVALVVAGCGARTGLGVGREVLTDAGCTSDASCDDGIACTVDRCDTSLGVCVRTLRDDLCDDGIFCDGTETCEVARGCVSSALSCDDGVACTNDSCSEKNRACEHAPDDTKCGVSQACNAATGCEQRAWAHDGSTLYDVRLPSGVVTPIGATGIDLTDVALDPKNVLFAVSFSGLEIVDQTSGAASQTISLAGESLNGADFAPDGTLYVSGDTSLFTLDPQSGALTRIAPFPPGLSSSGDLAFVSGQLLATATGGGSGDTLVAFDLASGTSSVVGPIGFNCVWGLAAYGTSLYGFTCGGAIIDIDPTTAASSQIQKVSTTFWGASAR